MLCGVQRSAVDRFIRARLPGEYAQTALRRFRQGIKKRRPVRRQDPLHQADAGCDDAHASTRMREP
jgi:hypothetical protein